MEGWAEKQVAAFEPEKTVLTLFSPVFRFFPCPLPTVQLSNTPLPYFNLLDMLCVNLDSHLNYRAHCASCAAKAVLALAGVGLLARARGGLETGRVRLLV